MAWPNAFGRRVLMGKLRCEATVAQHQMSFFQGAWHQPDYLWLSGNGRALPREGFMPTNFWRHESLRGRLAMKRA